MIITIFPVDDLVLLKQKVLNWLQQFSTFSFLDNNGYDAVAGSHEQLAAAGARHLINPGEARGYGAYQQLEQFTKKHKGSWIFGHLGYGFGADPGRPAESFAGSGFSDICLFVPEVVLRFDHRQLVIEAEDPQQIFNEIDLTPVDIARDTIGRPVIRSRVDRDEYIRIIRELRGHILRGDCYEINFCQEFYAEEAAVDPLQAYYHLTRLSPNPFAAMYRVNDDWLLCASPERYIRRQGSRIISQPIKGTAKRKADDPSLDQQMAESLYRSEKDRSENVMVVDLVRNDLSRICTEGSVSVDELYGVYTFPQVFQMISTISGELAPDISFADIIRATFPMGSMTGAPKKRVMELISRYEHGERGLFSGTIGYIDPSGNFDFNVVIRSILYNSRSKYLSMPAGSGITFYSDPAAEWEECMVKAEAMKQVFR